MKLLQVNKDKKEELKKCMEDKEHTVIILYYAAWCPHCKEMKPEWEKAAKKLAYNKKVKPVEVEHSEMAVVPKKYKKDVNSFPTIRKLKGGKLVEEYYGDRTEADLLRFAQS